MKNSYLGLEVTSSKIRYVVIDKKGHGFQILLAGSQDYRMSTASPEDLSSVISDILDRISLKPKRVFLTISRQDTLIRHIKLPAMNKKELEEVIKSEIEKIPAFLNNRFDFIFHKSNINKEKVGVLFAAINQRILNFLMSGIQRTRIPFRHLEISPLNLQEFVDVQQPSNKAKVYLVINDLVSYFVIYQNKQYKLFYKTATGLESLYPGGNDQVDERNLANLTAELQRVLKAYSSENKEDEIEKVSLVWDNEVAPNFDGIIKEKLGLEVEAVNVNQFADTSDKVDQTVTNPIYILASVPVFHYLGKIKEQFAFNHFFRAFHTKRYFMKTSIVTLLFLAIIGGVIGSVAYDFYKKRNDLQSKIRKTNQEINKLKRDSKDLYEQRDEYLAVRQGLLDQASFVRALNRVSWAQVFSIVAEDIPEDLALTSFEFKESGQAKFKGESFAVESVSELIRRVDGSTILKNGRFDFLKEDFIEEQKIFEFGIIAKLRHEEQNKDKDKEEKTESKKEEVK